MVLGHLVRHGAIGTIAVLDAVKVLAGGTLQSQRLKVWFGGGGWRGGG